MHPYNPPPSFRSRARAAISAVALLLGAASAAFAQTSETGSITGRVRSQSSGAALQGAAVSVSGSERYFTLSSDDGSFRINHVPAGQRTIIVNYTGLNTGNIPVTVTANDSTYVEVELTSEIYALEKFQVSTVRDGQAASINEQKHAPNVVNIVSTDAYGNVADTNVANLLMKLPGISPERDEAEAYQVTVRGIAADLNSVSVDGTLLAGASTRGDSRAFELDKVSTNSIESIEVIKAPTPDHDADSIGGKINLRTKNGFDSNGRRIRYSIGTNAFLQRYAKPSVGERRGGNGVFDFARAEFHPSASINFSDVLGKDKRWAVTFNASFNRTFSPRDQLTIGWDNGTMANEFPRYSEFTTHQDEILLDRIGVGGKVSFKLSPNTILFVNTMYNNFNDEMTQHKMRLQGVNIVSEVSPGVRDITARAHMEIENRTRTVETGMIQFGGRTQTGDWDIDYDISTSTSYGTDDRSSMRMRVMNLGFRVDRTKDIYFPTIEHTSGTMSDYSIGNTNLEFVDHQNYEAWDDVTAGKLNVKRAFNTRFPTELKTGLRYRHQEKSQDRKKDRWAFRHNATNNPHLNNYVGDGYTYFPLEGRYPAWIWPNLEKIDADVYANDDTDPNALYSRNIGESVKDNLRDDWTAGERIYATYLMGTIKTGGLTTVAGVRVEKTETYGSGVKENLLYGDNDPRRYEDIQHIKGGYTNYFPGVHFRYSLTPDLVFRGSFSTSIGRPSFTKLIPQIKVRELTDDDEGGGSGDPIPRIERNNPDLKPQFSDNIDLSAEYYMKGVGNFTLGVFRKYLEGFIYDKWDEVGTGPNNGFDGMYAGYALKTKMNGGWARVDGLELAYQQQLTFLPSPFDGLGVWGNATFLNSRGTYEDGLDEVRYEIKGFTKRSANGGISYIKYGFTGRVAVNFNGPRLQGYNSDVMRQFYDGERTSVDVSLAYNIPRTKSSLFLDVNNITNSTRTRYKHRHELQGNTQVYGMRVTAGIKGEF
jgi:TonB-dependent receptor